MNRHIFTAACVTALAWMAPVPAHAQDVKTVIASASKAMGADNLKTIEYSGSGADFSLGQAQNPSSPWPRFNDNSYTRTLDFEAPASRMQRVRTQGENPPRGGGGQPLLGEQHQTQVVTPSSPEPQKAQLRMDLMMLPWGFLKDAAANNASVKTRKMGGKKYSVVSFEGPNKAQVNGYINEQGMVEKIETWVDNTVLGDTLYESDLSDYKDFDGVKFPLHIVQKQGGWPVFELTVTEVKPNVEANIQPPQTKGRGGFGRGRGPGGGAGSTKLADGVYAITGGYNALAVEFNNYIVVIEGPQNDQRAQQIIDETRKVIPGKPIKYVVNTHVHFDHSGGLRAFVAEGATVVTHQMNKPYYEKAWANPHKLNPDKLAQSPRRATFETMTEKKVLTDGTHRIELYHVQNSIHNDGMIMAYLPKEKILVEADEFNPPFQPATAPPDPINPYNTNLVANLDRLKLDVQTIVPIHGRIVPVKELMTAVGKAN